MALVIAICFWLRGEAARDRKIRSTPPCDTCEHYKLSSSFSFAYAEHLCACPRVVERNAREIGLSRPSLIGDIRGTKLCKFEPKEKGGRMILGEVRTFPNVRADKEQALKPLEEAAEVFSAWESWTECCGSTDQILEEIADCITACCNLAAALGCEDMPRT